MCQNKQAPISLAINDAQLDLSVIGLSGHEALNEPYRFEIDLISANPLLDFNLLLGHMAYLSLGIQDAGIHGRICRVSQFYAGTDLSLYRVSLTPALQQLAQRRQRRIFQGLSVPQLIMQLLEEHGLDDNAYRFEHTTGLYPPRTVCVQHDESDLHLLQRLCEEEGIHFRFEHSRSQHLLIFSDDPASFPELSQPLPFQSPASDTSTPAGLSHLSERLWALPGYSGQRFEHEDVDDPALTTPQTEWVANQPFQHPIYSACDPQQLRRRQISTRTLQRLRCERYRVDGRSDHRLMSSGHIVQVLDHPQARYNDQWLLTSVTHRAWQPQVLEDGDRYDSGRILACIAGELEPPGYANSFTVLPWATPFRPPLSHPKPQIHGVLAATLAANAGGLLAGDALGCLPIHFDWQAADAEFSMAHIGDSELLGATAGTAVWVSHFDNDPDRPVICSLRHGPVALPAMVDRRASVQIDGIRIDPTTPHLHLARGQRLQIHAHHLSITGHGGRAELSTDGINLIAGSLRATQGLLPAERD